MNRRLVVILLTAFLVASGASYIVFRLIGNRVASAIPRTTRVVVASRDIPLGSTLRDSDLGTVDIAGAAPKDAIINRQDAVGRGVVSDLYQGEPILDSRLAAVGAGGGLAATIHPGMRACAVRVDDVVGVSGFVTPGMHVDVLISGTPPGPVNPSEGPRVKTILQNIAVLSAGTDIQKDTDGKAKQTQVVNLLVTPEQAEILSLASSQAHIQLVLRNPLDTEVADIPGSAVGTLYGEKPAVEAPRHATAPLSKPQPAPRPMKIEVYNGTKQTEATFSPGEAKR